MSTEKVTYLNSDMILNAGTKINPAIINMDEWEEFLDILCRDRAYQIVAIKTAISYFFSGQYRDIEDLIEKNWVRNQELHKRYVNIEDYYKDVQLPHKLSGVIDLVTGSGKSYVIYGIAQIALSSGMVDKVLVLCPSLTIEDGLKEKFISLSGNEKLKNAIPEHAKWRNPRIIDANSTIRNGDIAVENIHAVYDRTGSSIDDSFKGNGERTLVLSDEIHHAYNKTAGSNDIKRWKSFLLDDVYGFKYMLGFTGTAYIDNEYFNDVLYRYSFKQAAEDRVIKLVNYVYEDEGTNNYDAGENEAFQKIYKNHIDNKKKYHELKPLTIFVTKDIKTAKQLLFSLEEFLMSHECTDQDLSYINAIKEKVLVVTSDPEHKQNIAQLKFVDDSNNPIEWIISVSMLTEGWDVKNVFQIIPHEERAFNSKLLISQVLGRGLRIPEIYRDGQPIITVFNHDSWNNRIRALVNEVMEIEKRITASIMQSGARSKHNFDLYNINYQKHITSKESEKKGQQFDFSKGYINLVSQTKEANKETTYAGILSGSADLKKTTTIKYQMHSVEEAVSKISESFSNLEWEGKVLKLDDGAYNKDKMPARAVIKKIILTSLEKIGEDEEILSESNYQKVLSAFGTLKRKSNKTAVHTKIADIPMLVPTSGMQNESLSMSNLKSDSSIFYSDNYENEIVDDNLKMLQDIIEDDSLPKSAETQIVDYLFLTPHEMVFTKGIPERKFIQGLCKKDISSNICAWIKSRDTGFYGIEYFLPAKKSRNKKQKMFNPDFFIKQIINEVEYICVVEIKADGDLSIENKAKLKYARDHFHALNKELSKEGINQVYVFNMISPADYDIFFEHLKNATVAKGLYRSTLEADLEEDFED
ncbi:MAG: DEAD/DEAH box helicase family protein [Sulfuricurvum sp.]|jgi:type III restriction enzyme